MTIDTKRLQKLLHKHLCQDVKFGTRPYDGALMLHTPFQFPDGDLYIIHVTDSPTVEGGIRLSDLGHTEAEMSYECLDLDFFFEGAMGELVERVMKETGLKWGEKGQGLCMDTTPENLSQAVFQFGQALTKVYDVTLVHRFSKISAYYDRLNKADGSPADERQGDEANVIGFGDHAKLLHRPKPMQRKRNGVAAA